MYVTLTKTSSAEFYASRQTVQEPTVLVFNTDCSAGIHYCRNEKKCKQHIEYFFMKCCLFYEVFKLQ